MRLRKLPKKLKRVLVCIDSANVSIGLRNHGYSLDYKKFVRKINKISKSVKFYYYGPKFQQNDKHQKFLVFLKKQGIRLCTKEVKIIQDKHLMKHRKANFDVEITIDIIKLQDKFDTLLLLSGDSDFAAIVSYLHGKKKTIYVLSNRGNISKELIKEADGYLVLSEWREVLRVYKKSPRYKSGDISDSLVTAK